MTKAEKLESEMYRARHILMDYVVHNMDVPNCVAREACIIMGVALEVPTGPGNYGISGMAPSSTFAEDILIEQKRRGVLPSYCILGK